MDNIKNQIHGAILGSLIGDALGYPFSYKPTTPQKVRFMVGDDGEDPGTYQGASALSLCTMSSILECSEIVPSDILDCFNDFLIAGHLGSAEDCSDISEITIAAIKNYNNGMPPDKCGIRENNDNECLIRMLPIALECVNDDVDSIVKKSHQICQITHAEPMSQVVCAIYCLIIRTLINQKPEKVFNLLEDYYQTQGMNIHVKSLLDLKSCTEDRIIEQEDRQIEKCFWSAWHCYKQFDDFEECLRFMISCGGDANANGAVVGSLSGLVNGVQNIPCKWLETLILSTDASDVIQSFTHRIAQKINFAHPS